MFSDCPTHPASHHPCVPERVLILSRIGIACHCFLWREEGGDTAFPPAADVNSFLIVDGGERDCEASALITGKPRTCRIDGARCYRWPCMDATQAGSGSRGHRDGLNSHQESRAWRWVCTRRPCVLSAAGPEGTGSHWALAPTNSPPQGSHRLPGGTVTSHRRASALHPTSCTPAPLTRWAGEHHRPSATPSPCLRHRPGRGTREAAVSPEATPAWVWPSTH